MAFNTLYVLFVLSLVCSQAKAESTGSVFFIDSSSHQFLRKSSSDDVVKLESIAETEVGAAISVLLGFSPDPTLSAASSSKLNQILVPNPFQRPRSVFTVEVRGVDDSYLLAKDNGIFSSALSSKIVFGLKKAEIQLQDENQVAVLSLDEMAELTDKDIANFASWIGGTYTSESGEPLNGELTIPFANGATIKLHLSKKADKDFTLRILSLVYNLRKAIEMHEDLSLGLRSPAELLTGTFDGIKVLQEQGTEGIAQQGIDLLLATLSKLYNELQDAYKGQIVGVIVFHAESSGESAKLLNVAVSPQRASRELEETEAASIDSVVRVLLVRRTLAWITGIILLISTFLGIYFLMNMSVTRDTLLYSNVKLD